jgi:hypothetical protein
METRFWIQPTFTGCELEPDRQFVIDTNGFYSATQLIFPLNFVFQERVPLHEELADAADALCSAVRRAGVQALGENAEFSSYVYRHAMAADLKADKLDREDIALVMGHSVTETSSLYGYWQGGTAGVRQLVAEAPREVRKNHWHGKVAAPPPTEPSPMSSPQPLSHPFARRMDALSSAQHALPAKDEPKPY